MKAWSNRKRVVFVASICVAAAAAVAIAVAMIDDYARSEVKRRAKAIYFEELNVAVAEEVGKRFRQNGCSERVSVRGLGAAKRFLAKEQKHMSLQIRAPDWGWQVDRYRFAIRWRSTWIAKFNIYYDMCDQTYGVTDRIVNGKFKDVLEDVVCGLGCRVKCFFRL